MAKQGLSSVFQAVWPSCRYLNRNQLKNSVYMNIIYMVFNPKYFTEAEVVHIGSRSCSYTEIRSLQSAATAKRSNYLATFLHFLEYVNQPCY